MNPEVDRLLALFNRQAWSQLESAARLFVSRFPSHAFGFKALAVALTMLDKPQEALLVLEVALEKFPQDTELHNNRAAALIRMGRFQESIASADTSLALKPDNGSAYANKGLALKNAGYWRPALEAYHKAIELDPGDYQSLNNAGISLLELEQYDSAVLCFQAALALKPDFETSRVSLAIAEERLHRLKNACDELEAIVKANPDQDEARSRLCHLLRLDCEFDRAAAEEATLIKGFRGRSTGNTYPFAMLSLESTTRADQRLSGSRHAQALLGHLLKQPPLAASPDASGPRALRIGYLSADLHHHATAMLLAGVLESHDPERVRIHCYSYGRNDGSPMRQRLEAAPLVFKDVSHASFTEAAQQIAADRIDILVDLKGYTKDTRPQIASLRPAPVIVSWLGYPGSLGHPRLADYLIGDPVVTPVEHQADYSETLALMPHSYQPNDSRRIRGVQPARKDVGLPEDALVFCSFNQPYKITLAVFSQWARILRSVPDSVLWLLADRDEIREKLARRMEADGVPRSRLIFAAPLPITDHLGRLQNADLALDTFPYGSHTTGSDALWAGVPLISVLGDTFASRVSSSLLNAVGMPELIAGTPQAAADLAIQLANDRTRLSALRTKLAEYRATAPLFDTRRFTRDLERLYEEIWKQQLAGTKAPIVLPD